MLGIPLRAIPKVLTEWEVREYQAADALGILPDHKMDRYLQCAAAHVDPAVLEPKEPQDMSTLYERRKAMYGRSS
jgi:hypothetical protein